MIPIDNHTKTNPQSSRNLISICDYGNHFDVLGYLFKNADSVTIASPYLFSDFAMFFESFELKNIQEITLITTLNVEGENLLIKPFLLKNFLEVASKNTSSKTPIIHLNQKLHGKLYFFKKDGENIALIVTSANFTNNGLRHNNEYGFLTQDNETISELYSKLIANNDYENITENTIVDLCKAAQENEHKQTKKIKINNIDIGLKSILEKHSKKKLSQLNPNSPPTEISESSILIRLNRLYYEDITPEELYEATRGIWKVGDRRNDTQYAFSIYKGYIKEVYKIIKWHPACTLEYKTRNMQIAVQEVDHTKRWEFEGELASEEIREKYRGKSVQHLFKHGASNPIMYINC